MWTAKGLIDFEVQMLIGFGLACEFPLVLFILTVLGLVTSAQLASKRRHAGGDHFHRSLLHHPVDGSFFAVAADRAALHHV